MHCSCPRSFHISCDAGVYSSRFGGILPIARADKMVGSHFSLLMHLAACCLRQSWSKIVPLTRDEDMLLSCIISTISLVEGMVQNVASSTEVSPLHWNFLKLAVTWKDSPFHFFSDQAARSIPGPYLEGCFKSFRCVAHTNLQLFPSDCRLA